MGEKMHSKETVQFWLLLICLYYCADNKADNGDQHDQNHSKFYYFFKIFGVEHKRLGG